MRWWGNRKQEAGSKQVQSKGKQVVVCSMRGNVARELIKSADLYVDLYKLGTDVVRKVP